MSVSTAYVHGLSEASLRPKMVGLLWLANVLAALPAYLFFSNALGDAVGRSAMPLDQNAVLEVLTGRSGLVGGVLELILLGLAVALLVSPFLHGGILHVLQGRGGELAFGPAFFAGGARYYGRFLLLALGSIVLWLPAAALFLTVHVLLKALTRGSTDEPLVFALVLARAALAFLLLSVVRMVLDYARIRMVREGTPAVLGSLAWAAGFVVRGFGRTALLYALLTLTGWAMFAAFLGLDKVVGRAAGGAALPAFFLAQLFIAGRGWLRVAFQAGQLKLASEA